MIHGILGGGLLLLRRFLIRIHQIELALRLRRQIQTQANVARVIEAQEADLIFEAFHEELVEVQSLKSTFLDFNTLAQRNIGFPQGIDQDLLEVLLVDDDDELVSDELCCAFFQVFELLIGKE